LGEFSALGFQQPVQRKPYKPVLRRGLLELVELALHLKKGHDERPLAGLCEVFGKGRCQRLA
jgi:hypothetical protein